MLEVASLTSVLIISLLKSAKGYADSQGNLIANDTECEEPYQTPIDIPLSLLPDCSANNSYPNEITLNFTLERTTTTNFVIENDGYSLEAAPILFDTDNPNAIKSIEVIHKNTSTIAKFINPMYNTFAANEHKVHFHWGHTSNNGSEHYFDGNPYPLEAHLLCYSCDHGDIREAINAYTSKSSKDQYTLGVIGVLFEIGEPNAALDAILNDDIISRIRIHNNTEPNFVGYSYTPFNITDLLPENRNIVHYKGSLTTPPCYEAIRWFVMKNTLTVSEDQLNQFRQMFRSDNTSSNNNFRELNPINNRTLYNCEYQIINDYTNKEIIENNDENNDTKKLDGGSIVGIVLGCLVVVTIIVICIISNKDQKGSVSDASIKKGAKPLNTINQNDGIEMDETAENTNIINP